MDLKTIDIHCWRVVICPRCELNHACEQSIQLAKGCYQESLSSLPSLQKAAFVSVLRLKRKEIRRKGRGGRWVATRKAIDVVHKPSVINPVVNNPPKDRSLRMHCSNIELYKKCLNEKLK